MAEGDDRFCPVFLLGLEVGGGVYGEVLLITRTVVLVLVSLIPMRAAAWMRQPSHWQWRSRTSDNVEHEGKDRWVVETGKSEAHKN